ncbi:hypothetical protein MKEN_00381000 [Mycena kentingensis (nom. inval.)]|nr:hypothetical protein MKEN_00381000 [Mycena kentingensis (nom. inval.)]
MSCLGDSNDLTCSPCSSSPVCAASSSSSDSVDKQSTGSIPPTFVGSSGGQRKASRPSPAEEDPELSRVCGSVFAYGGRVSKLPDLRGHLLDTASQIGTPVLAKSESLDAFRRMLGCGYPLILRRPPNYGLDWLIAMLAAHLDYDYDLDDFIPRLIVPGPRQRKGLHDHFVLHLDLADLRRHQDLHTELIRYCHEQCQDFLDNNRSRLHLRRFSSAEKYPSAHFMYPMLTFDEMYLKDRLIGDPLFVLVTNFDERVDGFSDETPVLVEFLNGLGESMNDGIGGVLLTSNKDDGTISQCYTRSAAADVLILQPVAHDIKLENALDLTHHAAFQTAVGVTEQEINDLDGAFAASGHHPRDDRSLLDLVRAQARGVVFTAPPGLEVDEQWRGKKNPLDVLQSFSHLQDVKVYDPFVVTRLVQHDLDAPYLQYRSPQHPVLVLAMLTPSTTHKDYDPGDTLTPPMNHLAPNRNLSANADHRGSKSSESDIHPDSGFFVQPPWTLSPKSSPTCPASKPTNAVTSDARFTNSRKAFLHVFGAVFARSGQVTRVPEPTDGLLDIIETNGTPVVAKQSALDCCSAVHPATDFTLRFLESGSWPRTGLHKYHVLDLDFSQLNAYRGTLRNELLQYCVASFRSFWKENTSALQFMDKFRRLETYATDDVLPDSVIADLAFQLKMSGSKPLFVIVSNFDAPALQLNFVQEHASGVLHKFLDGLVSAKLTGILSGLIFLSTSENGIVRNCIGRTHSSQPVQVDHVSPLCRVALRDVLDITYHPAFQTAAGFTAKEIGDLDDAFAKDNTSRISERLVDLVGRKCAPAVFTSDEQHQANMELVNLDPFEKHPLRDLDWTDANTAVYPPWDVMRLAEEKYGPFAAS